MKNVCRLVAATLIAYACSVTETATAFGVASRAASTISVARQSFKVPVSSVSCRIQPIRKVTDTIVLNSVVDPEQDVDEGDGWNDDGQDNVSTAAVAPSTRTTTTETPTSTLSNQAQKDQLAELRSAKPRSNNDDNKEPERDLFIPIFALVSLGGLVGTYGYEMLRLYSRGELYLPWEQ